MDEHPSLSLIQPKARGYYHRMSDFLNFHGFQLHKGLLTRADLAKPYHAKPLVDLAASILGGEVTIHGELVESPPAEAVARYSTLEVAWCQVRAALAIIVAPEAVTWVCGCPLVIPGSCHGGEMPTDPNGAPIFRRRAYESVEMFPGDTLVMLQHTIVGRSNNNSSRMVGLWQMTAKKKKVKA